MNDVGVYIQLIKSFLSREISVGDFRSQYFSKFKQDDIQDEDKFLILDSLFADIDSYCEDPELRNELDIDEPTLRSRCDMTLVQLTAVSRKRG